MPELDKETRQKLASQAARLKKIEDSMPTYVQIPYRLCNYAENGLNLALARQNATIHEETHPGFEEWNSLRMPASQIREAIHDHECILTTCQCRSGCAEGPFCNLIFGDLCAICIVRDIRMDSEHGPKPKVDE